MRRISLIIAVVFLASLLVSSTAVAAPSEYPSDGVWHRVRYGETLFALGRLYRVNPHAIASANGLANWNYIYAGQRLWIPHHSGYQPYPKPYCARSHRVRYGETMYSIARWYGRSAWSIASANHIYNLNVIYAGQWLCIP